MAVLIASELARQHGRSVVDALRAVAPLFVISRALLLLTGVVALQIFPRMTGDGIWPGSPDAPWLAALSRWDGKWYIAIAQQGYGYHEGPASSMNFAPAYPALVRLIGAALRRADTDGLVGIGIVLSSALLLVALIGLYAIARRTESENVARQSVLWLVAIPSTFFLSAVYPESLFLVGAVSALLFALYGHWALAGALAGLAAVSRNYGVLLVVPLAWEYLEQHRWRPGRVMAWLLLAPAAFLAWQAYFWMLSSDPLAMSHAAEDWGRRLTAPWDMFRYYLSPTYWKAFILSGGAIHDDRTVLDLATTVLLGVLVALSWRLRRRSLAVLATTLYLPMICTGGFVSIPRYGLEVFPVFLVLARLTPQRWLLLPLVVMSFVLSVIAVSWFAVGGWFA